MKLVNAKDILDKIKNTKVVVLGDIMLDEYLIGSVTRISPEAPVPVVNITKEQYTLGGASNVAANIKAIGAEPFLIGTLQKDNTGNKLTSLLIDNDINTVGLVYDDTRPTTTKTRIMGGHQQQMLRLDREVIEPVNDEVIELLKHKLDIGLDSASVLIISDYAKNVIDKRIMDYVRIKCKDLNIPWVVDPKPRHKDLYNGATVLTPNTKELSELTNLHIESSFSISLAGNNLMSRLGVGGVLVTRSEQGMTLISNEHPWTVSTRAKEVYDVSGAGDTVISVFSAAIGVGCPWKDAANLANIAAGIVVGKPGTATTSPEELLNSLGI